ncbi:hypothetical protein BLL52_4180 [Rhodoferax antarcticus ANT.BR]|uniref:Uncharacterized protein n=1 Tax=Rhodoferax antarcticus ANT.BR TaxID=1111071 RepID=A0A1Q8Y972_9BURK|nr:hypothetical protein BLL52_4180 [Rhodoferax antarcticus ANT.BR]
MSFQIGVLEMPVNHAGYNNDTTATYTKAKIIKDGGKIHFPAMVPKPIVPHKGPSNTVASVIGMRNNYGGYDAVLVVRNNERLSSFNSPLRTVEDLVNLDPKEKKLENENRLGKGSNARVHNQVMLCGVIVGARFEDGDSPRFHMMMRQDSNINNVIPLVYEARNASALATRIKAGQLTTVDGEYYYRSMPVYELDADGRVKLDADRRPVPVLDENGVPKKRISTYIRCGVPRDPSEFDTDFGSTPPKWIVQMANDMAAYRESERVSREAAAIKRTAAKAATVDLPPARVVATAEDL